MTRSREGASTTRFSLGQLDALVAVAEHASVTVAAEELGISQPALTRRLQGLEKTMGVALLRPSGRGVALTMAGEEAAAAALRDIGHRHSVGIGADSRVGIASTHGRTRQRS